MSPIIGWRKRFGSADYFYFYGPGGRLLTILQLWAGTTSLVANRMYFGGLLLGSAGPGVDTAELLSKMTGTTTVQKASFNFSGSRFSPVMSHVNASVDHSQGGRRR